MEKIYTINNKEYSRSELLAVVQDPKTSSDFLETIARNRKVDEENKTFIARHPNTNSKTLVYLLRYDGVEMMGAIAEHANTSPEILELMVRSSDKLYTVYKLAQNPNTPAEALDELLQESNSEDIKLAIAQNPNTSKSSLKNLLNENELIRIEAQKNYDNSF